METNREEHLEWCKKRALEYLEYGEFYSLENAFISMLSDLKKHKDTENHSGIKLGIMLQMNGLMNTEKEVRKFIEGFN